MNRTQSFNARDLKAIHAARRKAARAWEKQQAGPGEYVTLRLPLIPFVWGMLGMLLLSLWVYTWHVEPSIHDFCLAHHIAYTSPGTDGQ